jgi:glucokinase
LVAPTRFTIATIGDDGAITLGEPATLKTIEHASFETAWEHFAQISGRVLPRAVALAVAGPVGGELIRFTNNPWVIRPDQLPERLGVDKVTIVTTLAQWVMQWRVRTKSISSI